MLQLIRDRATGWIAWVIVGLICVPFALFGINQYFGADQGLVVATVDDSEISYYQYRNAVQQQRARLQQMLGGNFSPELLDSPEMRDQVLQSLIDAEAMLQSAVKTGLRVGDAQVAKSIVSMPIFQSSGKFSKERYDTLLRAQGMSSQGFEQDLRRSMLRDQVQVAFRRTAIVTDAEIERVLSLRNEQRTIKLLTIEPEMLKAKAVDEATIKNWYDGHMDQYIQPEQVSLRYLELSREKIAETVTSTDEELRAIYEQRVQLGSYGLPEQRDARHILVELAAGASADEAAAARAAIDEARRRVIDGEDFAAVAKDVSQDAGSAPLGGSLGQFGRGVMDPAFEDVAFSLPIGEISEPVRSRFGWHLIEVTAIEAAKVRSFEEARAEILKDYQLSQADEIFAEQAERLATLAFEHPESLEVAAQTLAVPVLSSGFFSLSGEGAAGVSADPRVRDAAFSSDVLEAGNNSELIELADERSVVVRVAERKAQRQKTLDEVRDEIAAMLKAQDAAKRAADLGQRALEGLRKGKTVTELSQELADEFASDEAQPFQLSWGESKALTRDGLDSVPSEVAGIVFRMTPPGADKVSYEGASLRSGAYAVVGLTQVSQVDPTQDQDALKDLRARIVRELQAGRGEQTLTAVQKSLRRRADVVIKERNLRPDES